MSNIGNRNYRTKCCHHEEEIPGPLCPAQKRMANLGGLFNAKEDWFNLLLVNEWEKRGYKCFTAQRDGFLFQDLVRILGELLPPADVSAAGQEIIYALDLGWAVGNAKICFGNFDDPQDPGVVIEMDHAFAFNNKIVIGHREDFRTPHGLGSDELAGMHWFPPYNTHSFVIKFANGATKETIEHDMIGTGPSLINLAESEIERLAPSILSLPKASNSIIDREINASNLLFQGVLGNGVDVNLDANYYKFLNAIHTNAGLTKVVNNYLLHKNALHLRPTVLNNNFRSGFSQ